MAKATHKDLGDLHGVLAKELTARIKNGDATSADLNAAIAFLRANEVRAERTPESPLDNLGKAVEARKGFKLPFEGEGEAAESKTH